MEETLTKKQSVINEIIDGLSRSPKFLPSKYFYDEVGSKLFDEITELDEYYPTRTERKILEDNLVEMGQLLGDDVELIEPGSGSSEKTRILLDHLPNIHIYVPIDISGDYLFKVAEKLQEEYPDISIEPLAADYTRPFELPDRHPDARRIVFFPGSTIGNFRLNKVQRFFSIIAQIVGKKGGVLIGVDLKKDIQILEEAYNDSKGITADFNKNMLTHLNSLIDTDFDINNYQHKAVWVEDKGAIEMRLYSKNNHTIKLNGHSFEMIEGEYLHTENSHKYTIEEFSSIVSPWFEIEKVWMDDQKLFSVQYLVPRDYYSSTPAQSR
jgi:dimethylhistidine N-methyltransferase